MEPNQHEDNTQSQNDIAPIKPYPTLGQAWGLFGMFFVFSLLVGILIFPFKKSVENNKEIEGWLTLAAYVVLFICLIYYAVWMQKIRLQPTKLHFGKPSIVALVLLLFITPLLAIVTDPIGSLIPMPDFMEKYLRNIVKPNFVSFLSVVVAAPLCEEIFCRGIILEGLLKNRMKPSHAIIWSAFIFAALHLNPWQGIAAFTMGCLMGWVYYKTRSLLLSIFIHFVNNGFVFLLLMKYKDTPDITTEEIAGSGYWWIFGGAAIILALLVYALYSYFKTKPQPQYEQ